MHYPISEKDSSVTPILKNARYFIINRARKMIQRWQNDWEKCRKQWIKRCKHSNHTPENTNDHLLWDEFRLLQQEQKVLDALDDTLNGVSLHHVQQNHNPALDYSWTQHHDSDATETWLSRSGCTMRYR
jgi:hypothetical protein